MSAHVRSTWCKRILIALALVSILGFGATTSPVWALSTGVAHDVSTPITVEMKMDRLPTVGQTATLSCVAKSVLPAPGTTVKFVLPAGATVVGGTGRWTGTINPGSPVTLTAVVRFSQPGNAQVSCDAQRTVDANDVWGDHKSVYLSVGMTQSTKGYTQGPDLAEWAGNSTNTPVASPDDALPIQRGSKRLLNAPAASPDDHEPSAPQSANAPAGSLTVKGRWMHYDRTGTAVAARKYLVELVNATTSDHLAFCNTTADGYYTCGPVTNPKSDGIKVFVYTHINYKPYSDVLQVTSQSCGTDWTCSYAIKTKKFILSGGTQDIGTWYVPKTWINSGAFWIKDDIDRAWRYIYNTIGSSQIPVQTGGPTTAYWAPDSTDGTYYNVGGEIHLAGDDQYSHDTAIHEYGHNVMYNVYQDFPPANCPDPHYLNISDQDTVCAWTEGWADFFPLAVNNDPLYHWSPTSYKNLETPTWGSTNWDNGDEVEGRVAGALWDIFDSTNEGHDQVGLGFVPIWKNFHTLKANTFMTYYLSWLLLGNEKTLTPLAIYQNTIDYRYPAKPTLISPANGYVTFPIILPFSWNPSSRANSYQIQVRKGSTTGTVVYTATNEATSAFSIFGDLGWYYWRVRGCNVFGCGTWSDYRSFKIKALTQ